MKFETRNFNNGLFQSDRPWRKIRQIYSEVEEELDQKIPYYTTDPQAHTTVTHFLHVIKAMDKIKQYTEEQIEVSGRKDKIRHVSMYQNISFKTINLYIFIIYFYTE